MTDITIKFPRPDGEARLEWQERGHVLIRVATTAVTYSSPRDAEYVESFLANYVPHSGDRSTILLAAEKLRNKKRRLLPNEWRDEGARTLVSWSKPTLTGCLRSLVNIDTGELLYGFPRHEEHPRQGVARDSYLRAYMAWHRAAYLPLLKADECYPPGELPRRMNPDEVRFPDGSAGRMTAEQKGEPWTKTGMRVCIGSAARHRWWAPDMAEFCEDHPARNPSQLLRLQSFWDRGQPKEAELNLRWEGRSVRFDFAGLSGIHFDGRWNDLYRETMPADQRATVEAFFLAGPPVELAEDIFSLPLGGHDYRWEMRIVGDALQVRPEGAIDWHPKLYSRKALLSAATDDPDPHGWPRALAYFDRHVKREPTFARCPTCGQPGDADHCPARVTDVRFMGRLAWPCVYFKFQRSTRGYYGNWDHHDNVRDRLHPLDIALIERCWAEGQKDTFQGTHVGWSQADEAAFRKAWEDERNKQDSGPEVAASALAAKPVLNADSQRETESAVVTEAHSVTPSGEVKAPEWWPIDGREVRLSAVLEVAKANGFDSEKGGFLEWLTLTCAALSDHIRRGDGPHAAMIREVNAELGKTQLSAEQLGIRPAPDLTELREALRRRDRYQETVSKQHRLSSVERLNDLDVVNAARKLCAVERLVK